MLHRRTCKARFSEPNGMLLFDARLPPEVEELRRRPSGRLMDLKTSDDYPARRRRSSASTADRHAAPGRQTGPLNIPAPGPAAEPDLRNRDQATRERPRLRGWDADRLRDGRRGPRAAGISKVDRAISAAFIEHEDGTDRHRNARNARKTRCFSKGRGRRNFFIDTDIYI
jgi:hypothetical protein